MTTETELSGAGLDLAVANALKAWEAHDGYCGAEIFNTMCFLVPIEKNDGVLFYSPRTDWSIGGPIIESERVNVCPDIFDKPVAHECDWIAWMDDSPARMSFGPTPLIAAMRAIVKKYGAAK